MTEAVYFAIKYLESLAMPLLMYSFLNSMFLPRSEKRGALWGKLIFCMLAVVCINSFNNPVLNLWGVTAVLTGGALWIFRLSLGQAPLYVSFFVILMVNVEMVTVYLREALGIPPDQAHTGAIVIRTAELFLKAGLIEVAKKQVKSVDREREHGYMGFLTLFSAAVFILLMSGVYPGSLGGRENILMIFSGLCFILANIAGFSVEESMMEAARNQQNNRLMAQKAELEKLHYRRMEELTREYGEYIHELEHSLRTLRQLWDSERESAAGSLCAAAGSLERHFHRKLYLSDPIVNAILTEKEQAGRERGLAYRVQVSTGLNLNFIEDLDKISMFGNLLDNGAQAALQTENGFVNVNLHMGNKALFVFEVVNSCAGSPRRQKGSYLTTKEDWRSHGFGIKKVRELALKYKGILELEQEEGKFTATLILSTVQKTDN